MDKNDFRPNSAKFKDGTPPEKKVDKVIEGTVMTKKKSGFNKLASAFISEDADNVGNYIWADVLVPAIKKAVSDMITNGIDMLLYGGNGNRKSNSPGSRVSYSGYYDRENPRRERGQRPVRQSYSYDEIVIATRGDAEVVLSAMHDMAFSYGVVSVADFYDLVGVTGSYTDNNYGWTDVNSAQVIRVRDGYAIKFPKAVPIN